jgi:hypothetical protein
MAQCAAIGRSQSAAVYDYRKRPRALADPQRAPIYFGRGRSARGRLNGRRFDANQCSVCNAIVWSNRALATRSVPFVSDLDHRFNPLRRSFFDRQKTMKAPRRSWSEDELKHALDLRAAGHSYREIDRALGRWAGATQQRLQIAGHGSGDHVKSFRAPERVLAEYAARDPAICHFSSQRSTVSSSTSGPRRHSASWCPIRSSQRCRSAECPPTAKADMALMPVNVRFRG